MANKYLIGFLTLVVLSASIYILLPDNVRIDIENTRSVFKVYENNSWIISGIEYTKIYDGTKLMRASNRAVNYSIDLNINETYIYRYSYFKDEIIAIDTYIFDGNTVEKEQIPKKHIIRILNANNKILQYEVNNILYSGETKEINSPFSFGHNMKVEWESGSYYSKVFQQKTASDKIIIKYKIDLNDYTKEVRLFDPPWWNASWSYLKIINITENSGNNLVNYPIVVSNFDCEGKCNNTGKDIRVVYNNQTELPFGLQNTNGTVYNITFKVNIPTNGYNDTIYIYYGNPTVDYTNTSWESNRYNVYDDFSTNTLNVNWVCVNDPCSYNSITQTMVLSPGIINSAQVNYNGSSFVDSMVEYDLKQTSGSYVQLRTTNSSTSTTSNSLTYNYIGGNISIYNGTETTSVPDVYDSWKNDFYHVNNTFYHVTSEQTTITVGGNKTILSINSTIIPDIVYFGLYDYYGTAYFDNFSVRNYVTPEPTVTILSQNLFSCTYSGSGDWNINCADNCNITSEVVGDGSNLNIIGSGTTTISSNIRGFKNIYTSGGEGHCNINCYGGCFV